MDSQETGPRMNNRSTSSRNSIDPTAWQERLDRLTAILNPIAEHATTQACWRCPYKDRHDQCTAAFSCRNQRRQEDSTQLRCAGDDKLDYRSAWEVSKGTTETVQKR